MILVGQYDSPFVRRVAIALNYFGMEFERRILSTFQDLDKMLAINPLGKVPAFRQGVGSCRHGVRRAGGCSRAADATTC